MALESGPPATVPSIAGSTASWLEATTLSSKPRWHGLVSGLRGDTNAWIDRGLAVQDVSYVIVGGGGHARSIREVLLEKPIWRCQGYTAPSPSQGFPEVYLGNDEYWRDPDFDAWVVLGVGDCRVRANLLAAFESLHVNCPALVSLAAAIAADAIIRDGCVVMPGAVIRTGAQIGAGSVVNSGAIVDHDCRIGRASHIAPGAVLCGSVEVGDCALVGANAVVLPGIAIGDGSTVGAGSVVTKDVRQGRVVAGNPARFR
jgi:sugar O-acyltransferase (sialic acid O-acetyltransferase NeuD family)